MFRKEPSIELSARKETNKNIRGEVYICEHNHLANFFQNQTASIFVNKNVFNKQTRSLRGVVVMSLALKTKGPSRRFDSGLLQSV